MTVHALGIYHALHMGQVVDNQDPDSRGRVKVKLLANDMEVWANVVVPSAGNGYGVAFLPRLNEIVVLAFIAPEEPLVLGSIWAGNQSTPSEADEYEDNYVLKTPNQVLIHIDDKNGPKLEITTPRNSKITLDDANSHIMIERNGQSVELTDTEITVTATSKVTINAGQVNVSAGMVQVDAGMSKFSGVVQADTVIATSVVGTSYTPGAGNIW